MAIKLLCFFILCHIVSMVSVVCSQGTSSVTFTTYQRVKSREELNRLLAAMQGYTGASGGRKIDTEYLKTLRPDTYGLYQVPVAHYEYTVHHPPTPKRFMHSTPTKITLNANGHFQKDDEKPCRKSGDAKPHNQDPVVTEDDEQEDDMVIFDRTDSTIQNDEGQTTVSDVSNTVNDVKKLIELQDYSLTSTPSKPKCSQGEAFIQGRCQKLFLFRG